MIYTTILLSGVAIIYAIAICVELKERGKSDA